MNREKPRGKVLVTGANGFVGSAVVRALAAGGWHVLYCSRQKPERENEWLTWVPYDLAWQSLPADFGTGADALVHAALADRSSATAPDTNVTGARLLVDAAHRNGIKRRIFISSFAARADAPSQYGRQKYAIEEFFKAPHDAIVRPGLVIGDGGLFRALCRYLRRYRVVPLIDGGCQPIQTVLDEDLAAAIVRIVSGGIGGAFDIAEATQTDYRTFWKAVAGALRVPILLLPVPFRLAELATGVAGEFSTSALVARERLLGLKGMRFRKVTSDPRVLPSPLRRYEESIQVALSRATR